VRFAKDKTPYKTHCGGCRAGARPGAFYVQLSSDGCGGGGLVPHQPGPAETLRESVADDLRARAGAVLDRLRKQGWGIHGERLKTKPRGYDATIPGRLLRHKTL